MKSQVNRFNQFHLSIHAFIHKVVITIYKIGVILIDSKYDLYKKINHARKENHIW